MEETIGKLFQRKKYEDSNCVGILLNLYKSRGNEACSLDLIEINNVVNF